MTSTCTSATAHWIISRQAGPLPAVRRLRFLPELAEGVATVAAFGTFYVCIPRGRRPALTGRDAGCSITPVDNSPPTRTSYDPVQGRFTIVAASSRSSSGNPYRAQQIHVVQAWWHRPDLPAHALFIRNPMTPALLG